MKSLMPGTSVSWAHTYRLSVVSCVYDMVAITGRALYQVRNEDDGLYYALKLIDESTNDPSLIQAELVALNRQTQLADRLPRYRAFWRTEGFSYLMLDWMDGTAFDSVTRSVPISNQEDLIFRFAMLSELAKTMEYVHRSNFVHRDLKPQNILLRNPRIPADGVTVIDFGSAVMKRNLDEGTYGYQAPEQSGRRNFNISPATDVFAMAQVGWFLMTGQPLLRFPNNQGSDWSDEVSEDELGPPDLLTRCDPLRKVLLKAMSYNPRDRLPNATALRASLSKIANLIKSPGTLLR